MTVTSPKSCFPFVTFTNTYQIVSASQINFGEITSAGKSIEQIRKQRKWILIRNGDPIQTTIIHHKAKTSILLGNKEHQSTSRRMGMADETGNQIRLYTPSRLRAQKEINRRWDQNEAVDPPQDQ